MTTASQTIRASIKAEKIIDSETHILQLNDLGPELSGQRWFDRRPRRFELVYTWVNTATGGVKGETYQGATWKDYWAVKKLGLFGHYDLF